MDFASRSAPIFIIFSSSSGRYAWETNFSSASGSAFPAVNPSASKICILSSRNPGVGNTSRNSVNRLARYPVSSRNSRAAPSFTDSPLSILPATNSHRYCRAAWRYCRTITIRPSVSTGRITTDPGCEMTSRVARSPSGSTISSCRTPNTFPWSLRAALAISKHHPLLARSFRWAFFCTSPWLPVCQHLPSPMSFLFEHRRSSACHSPFLSRHSARPRAILEWLSPHAHQCDHRRRRKAGS